MNINAAELVRIAGGPAGNRERLDNAASLIRGLSTYGFNCALHRPEHLVGFIATLSVESGAFKYDRELWGPTPAQRRYEGRADLGNVRPGDGSKYRGYGPIQLTGRDNVTRFRDWCRERIRGDVPDFVADPRLILSDPWEGLSAVWFWSAGNSKGQSLNRWCANFEFQTKVVNGGLNHYAERCDAWGRAAMAILNYSNQAALEVAQRDIGVVPDGVCGPATRAAFGPVLRARDPLSFVTGGAPRLPQPRPVKPVPTGSGWLTMIINLIVDFVKSFGRGSK